MPETITEARAFRADMASPSMRRLSSVHLVVLLVFLANVSNPWCSRFGVGGGYIHRCGNRRCHLLIDLQA